MNWSRRKLKVSGAALAVRPGVALALRGANFARASANGAIIEESASGQRSATLQLSLGSERISQS
ncbi:MAG: hypothetical protein KGL48_01890 [Sphingomonadales bacterium]|nr:hypothetical protein [Sphingomonadales bacterium]MDE2569888.1 hypothetical protein [Sphingomonadales bacterium]